MADVWDHVRVRQYETGPAPTALADANVALIGLFSGKDKDFGARLDQLASLVEARGGRVVGRHVQRRGVSHGGVAKMTAPFSRRTLLSPGKTREVAQACRATGVDVAVFVNPLTEHQRTVLADVFGCLVISGEDLVTRDR
jgi:50S ribosomal subunit-associated GTPase HflX